MGFIRTLLILFLVWQGIKWLVKLYLRYLVKKSGGRGFAYTYQTGQSSGYQRPTGDVKVDSFGQSQPKKDKGSLDQLGEYVDFEEVK